MRLLHAADGLVQRHGNSEQIALRFRAAAGANEIELRRCFDASRAVSAQPFVAQGLAGPAIGEAMMRARIVAVKALMPEKPHADGTDGAQPTVDDDDDAAMDL